MVIKNIWSLSADEAIVADAIKHELEKTYEVFFPVNSHLKDIDLIVFNLKNGKTKTIQVKGSRTYGQNDDQHGWTNVKKEKIFNTTNKTDFFIFVWHMLIHKKRKRIIEQAYIVIPLAELQKICKNEKTLRNNGEYHFYFYTDLKTWVCDYPREKNRKKDEVDFSKYLNNFDLLKK